VPQAEITPERRLSAKKIVLVICTAKRGGRSHAGACPWKKIS
jgi:hypothetical protein